VKLGTICVLIVAGLALSAQGGVIMGPTAEVLVNNQSTDLIVRTLFDDTQGVWTMSGDVETAEYKITISATTKEDPFIQYGVTAQNFMAVPQTFSFAFSTPIVPAPYSAAFASVSGSMTDDISGNGVTITPVFAKLQRAFAAAPVTNLGVDVGNGGTGGPGAPLMSYTLAADSLNNTFAPTSFNTLSLNLDFTLTANDVATFNGGVEITPEPGCLSLLGLAGLALLRRRS